MSLENVWESLELLIVDFNYWKEPDLVDEEKVFEVLVDLQLKA
jgi:hypothetical protein